MDTLIFALVLGIPAGLILTAIQLVIARRQIVRSLQLNPPPEGAKHRDRYLTRPLLSTLGLVFPLSLLAVMCVGAMLLAYIVAPR